MTLEEIEVGKIYMWDWRFHAHETLRIKLDLQVVRVIKKDDSGYLPVKVIDKNGGYCFVDPETLSPITEDEL